MASVIKKTTTYDIGQDSFTPLVNSLDYRSSQLVMINNDIMSTDFNDGTGAYKTLCLIKIPNMTIINKLTVNMIDSKYIDNTGNISTKSLNVEENTQTKLVVAKVGNIDSIISNTITSQLITSSSFVGTLTGIATEAIKAFTSNCCDYVYDMYYDGKVKEIDCNKKDFKIRTIDETFEFVEKNRHLPTIMGREEYIKTEGKIEIGKMFEQLWETVEIQSIYIKELHERIKKLEEQASRTSV